MRPVALGLSTAIIGPLVYGLISHSLASYKLPIVFVNETRDHKYDRALRSSIRTFQERTHLQLGVVLKDRLPPMTAIESYAAETFQQFAVGERSRGKGILFSGRSSSACLRSRSATSSSQCFPMRSATGSKRAGAPSCCHSRCMRDVIS